MNSIHIIGGSNAGRLSQALSKNIELLSSYNIKFYKGANFSEISLPKNVSKNDIVLLWSFGNSLFEKEFLYKSQGKFHLRKVVKLPVEKILNEFSLAKEFLENCVAEKKFIFTNTIRHGNCCNKHSYYRQEIISFQLQISKKLVKYFQEVKGTKVIKTECLLPLPRKQKKVIRFVEKLLQDSVHFFPYVYPIIGKNFISKCMK